MSPAARRERVDTFLALSNIFVQQRPMAVLRVFKVMVGVMFSTYPSELCYDIVGCRGLPRGISGGSPIRGGTPWSTREVHLMLCVLFFPDADLLGHECQRDKVCKLEVSFCDCGHKALKPQLKAVSLGRNRVISDLDAVYLPWRSRNNYAIMIILLSSMMRGSPDAVDILEMWRRTWRGVGLN